MKIKKKSLELLLSSCIVFFLYSYIFIVIFPTYIKSSVLLSRGVYWLDIIPEKLYLSIFLFIIVFILMNSTFETNKTASSYISLFLFFVGYLPENIIFFSMNLEYSYFIYLHIFWGILFIFLKFFKKLIKKNITIIGTDLQRKQIFIVILVFFMLMVLYVFARYGNFKFNINFNVDEIYELRIDAREYGMGKMIDYIRNNAMYVILPTSALIFLAKKRYLLFFSMVVFQFMLYSIDNQKAAFFLIVLSFVGYVLYRKTFFYSIPNYIILLSLFTIFMKNTNLALFIIKNFYERLLFLPAILGYQYFKFFLTNPPIIPFVSLFKKMGIAINYPYDDGISFIMGDLLFNNRNISANTGSFGSAFSYGMLGLVLIPIFYAILLVLFDLSTSKISIRIFISLILIQVFVILNVSIFIVLTSYGLIFGIIYLSLINENKYFNELE